MAATTQTRAVLLALAAVGLWSTVAAAFKIGLRHLEVLQLLLHASIASTAILAAVAAAQGKLGLVRRCSGRQLLGAAGLGVINPFLYYIILFEAFDRLPAQVAQALNYTWALTLGLLAVPLLGQRFRWRLLAAGAICYGGVVIIATGTAQTAAAGGSGGLRVHDPLGVALALGSTVLWALYWIGAARSGLDPVVGLLLNFLFALPLIATVCAVFSDPFAVTPAGLACAAYVGCFEMGLTFVLWLGALKLSDSAAKVSNCIFLSPWLSLLFIRFIVGEPIATSTWIGLPLIIGGLAIGTAGPTRGR